ncbi:hypothetical protein PR048_013856 [Dryococelus australis]|uniref:Uncharacterized protein n=1 Tax=Dryococelus australis TaxID=614101 RepID=A0ABQ9HTC8_9NEOP|nr:hypothetical protein PR048_013856 [Dryococelus australis]
MLAHTSEGGSEAPIAFGSCTLQKHEKNYLNMPPISRKSLFEIWVENRKDSRFDAMFDFVLQQVESGFSIIVPPGFRKTLHFLKIYLKHNHVHQCKRVPLICLVGLTNLLVFVFVKLRVLKIKGLLDSVSQEELSMATEMTLRNNRKRDSAAIARKLLYQKLASLSTDETLAMIVDTNLSTNDYKHICQQVNYINCKCFPPYYKSLIDHTVTRLCNVQQVLESLHLLEIKALAIIIKWECDGAEQIYLAFLWCLYKCTPALRSLMRHNHGELREKKINKKYLKRKHKFKKILNVN